MARSHTMTPRRRAALRKAQLVSARKRRKKNTVGKTVNRAVRQKVEYTAASFGTRSRVRSGKRRTRKAMTYAAVGLVGAGAAFVGTRKTSVEVHPTPAGLRGRYGYGDRKRKRTTFQHAKFGDRSRMTVFGNVGGRDVYVTTKPRRAKKLSRRQARYDRAQRAAAGTFDW